MQKLSKNLKVWLYASFVLTGTAVVLLTVMLFTGYNSSSNYFSPSLPYSIFKGFCISAILLAVLSFIFTPKGKLNGDSPLTLPVLFPSVLFALILLGMGVLMLGSLLGISIVGNIFVGQNTALLIFGAIFSFISVAYFIFNCFPQNGKLGEGHALFGFAVPAASAVFIATTYFDLDISMNAPIKLLFHLSMIFFMLWLVYELRVQLKKPMSRLYFAFGIVAMFFSGVASLPWIIAGIAGILKEPVYPAYTFYNLVSFAVFCYITVRLIVYVQARDIFERIADQTPPEIFYEDDEEQKASNEQN